jgi:hypothetical protein
MSLLHTGDQLELEFHDVRLKIPWSGRSPRELTRVHLEGIFKAGAAKSVRAFVDPAQTDLFGDAIKGPPRYEGAPLLFERPRGPLQRRDDHGQSQKAVRLGGIRL